ncbi:MAG: energy transducer TonB [Ferruginibacter sp.]
MKRKNVFSMLLGTAFVLSLSVISCTNNDTTDSSTTTTDTSTAKMETVTPMDTASAPSTMATDNSTTPAKPGMAKPDPSKKGMKGKVSIVPVTAAKTDANAKMEADNTGVYSNVEVLPSFPGGYKGLQKFFDNNLEYPADATNDGVEGTVNVTFVVDETGKLTSPKVEGDNLGYGLEAEALRVVNKMPTWNPGKLKGKNVKTKFTLPVKFVLY